ncbi:GTPase [Gymnopus androsaceus JB14]|uniref:GTPase n=1 Tax=Gymnopus androsaceus JB14 TaxID=1447944 RepID=A0A6A4HT62_9AGAR|nr:GTPase [Gymnopus androsaceus JB14]
MLHLTHFTLKFCPRRVSHFSKCAVSLDNRAIYRDNEALANEAETYRRRRKTEWKRRQGGQNFLDHLIINIRGGKGGDGCAAFHREKFLPFGPPSGGNGGRGGDVYIQPTTELTTLNSVAKRVRGENGGNGQGTWQNGKNGSPLVIRVPVGTIVRQLPRDDPRTAKDEWDAEAESLEGLEPAEKQAKMRDNRWVHYPRYSESNVERDSFIEAEQVLYKQERERRYARRKREIEEPIYLDLDKEVELEDDPNSPLGLPRKDGLGHLVALGGQGGVGNPHFLTQENRSPKFATRGHEGDRVTLSLELKLLADIGLVGVPNAGKSTLLRALTGGRAKTEVAGYAFTTLNPVVGVVRVAQDGSFEGGLSEGMVHDETLIEEAQIKAQMEEGAFADALTRNQQNNSDSLDRGYGHGHSFDIVERFRFTIADNPGLISKASENVVYVVDFSVPAPWDDIAVLRDELEQYLPGMSRKARMVIANKADLLAGDGDPASVEEAKLKLTRLEEFVAREMSVLDEQGDTRYLDVVPISAKFSQNLKKAVGLMEKYVVEAREAVREKESSTSDDSDWF